MALGLFLLNDRLRCATKCQVVAVAIGSDHLLNVLAYHVFSLTHCQFFSAVFLAYDRSVSRKPRQLSRYLAEAEKLSRVIREARAEAGLTQIEVAGRSGVPYSTLRAIERAQVKEPSFFAVMHICIAIGVKPTQLEALVDKGHKRATGPDTQAEP